MPIPDHFDERGLLPRGDHEATLDEVRGSILVEGPATPVTGWDRGWRLGLVDRLQPWAERLWEAGVEDITLDGSFVTDKPYPGDLDACYDAPFDQQRRILVDLAKRYPSLRPTPGQKKSLLWIEEKIELYPAWFPADDTNLYRKFFRLHALAKRGKTQYIPKGVVVLKRPTGAHAHLVALPTPR